MNAGKDSTLGLEGGAYRPTDLKAAEGPDIKGSSGRTYTPEPVRSAQVGHWGAHAIRTQ